MAPIKIQVREVWQSNFQFELSLIEEVLLYYHNVSMDTEFPGTIINQTYDPSLPASEQYSIMKENVDELKLIQLGLTLSDDLGNLPHFHDDDNDDNEDGIVKCVWQFNFRDFDPDQDLNDPEAISLLRTQGIDFSENKLHGIDSKAFAREFFHKVLSVGHWVRPIKWITFEGSYDYGYLIKILTGGRKLPEKFEDYMVLKRQFFGDLVFDTRLMGKAMGLYGGLERMAKRLKLERVAGKSHQAGSDSLLTMQLFVELMKKQRRRAMASCRRRVPVIPVIPVIPMIPLIPMGRFVRVS